MAYLIFFYAIFILIGGIAGYFKASSLSSLSVAISCTSLLFMALWGFCKKKRWGMPLAFGTTLLLDLIFNYRFLLTFKFLPSGLLSLVSLVVLIFFYLYIKNPLFFKK